MSKIDSTFENGLCGKDLDNLVTEVSAYQARNKVAWFCLLAVLKRVRAEWQDDGDQGIPRARAEDIDRRLIPIVRRFLSHTLDSSFAETQGDLERLVQEHSNLYSP